MQMFKTNFCNLIFLQPVVRIYDIPDSTFESDEEEDDSSSEDDEDSDSEGR